MFMVIPRRRERLPRARVMSRSVIIALVAVVGLIVSLVILRRRAAQPTYVSQDTLVVYAEGLQLNGESVEIGELRARYTADTLHRSIHVMISSTIQFGQTWAVRDSLGMIEKLNPNLMITGLE